MLSNYNRNDSLVRHLDDAPAPSLLTRAEINRQTQRAYVQAQQQFNNYALDALEDNLLHRRIEANLDYQTDEVELAVNNARRTPEAEPYLLAILGGSNARRVRRLM